VKEMLKIVDPQGLEKRQDIQQNIYSTSLLGSVGSTSDFPAIIPQYGLQVVRSLGKIYFS
jgi:hypothetical protein